MFPNHMHANYLLPKGNTEREFLANFESIVRNSLPLEKLIKRHLLCIELSNFFLYRGDFRNKFVLLP